MRGQLRTAKSDAERECIRGEIDVLDSNIESRCLAWELPSSASPQPMPRRRASLRSAFGELAYALRRI
jgi:hypothetical protein